MGAAQSTPSPKTCFVAVEMENDFPKAVNMCSSLEHARSFTSKPGHFKIMTFRDPAEAGIYFDAFQKGFDLGVKKCSEVIEKHERK